MSDADIEIRNAIDELLQELGRLPTVQQVQEKLKSSEFFLSCHIEIVPSEWITACLGTERLIY